MFLIIYNKIQKNQYAINKINGQKSWVKWRVYLILYRYFKFSQFSLLIISNPVKIQGGFLSKL